MHGSCSADHEIFSREIEASFSAFKKSPTGTTPVYCSTPHFCRSISIIYCALLSYVVNPLEALEINMGDTHSAPLIIFDLITIKY
jgi:hypothetical protein